MLGSGQAYAVDGYTNKMLDSLHLVTDVVLMDYSTNTLYISGRDVFLPSNTTSIYKIENEVDTAAYPIQGFPEDLLDFAIDDNDFLAFAVAHFNDSISVAELSFVNPNFTITLPSVYDFNDPAHLLEIDPVINKLYIASTSGKLYMIEYSSRTVTGFRYNITSTLELEGAFPQDIAFNPNTRILYYSTEYPNRVFAIDGNTNKLLENITLDSAPGKMHIDINTNRVFVTKPHSNSIAVINGTSNAIEEGDILVGNLPTDISFNPNTKMIYVANSGSNSITEINGSDYNVLATTVFNVNPPNSGYIKCNGKEFETNKQNMIGVDTLCEAVQNKGFQFNSWVEHLGKNSTRTISTSTSTYSLFDSLLTAFGYNPVDKASLLYITKYGNFTANFKEVPPPIPSEYWIPLYGIIVSTVVGWSIPSIITWHKSRKQVSRLNSYHKKMSSIYDDGKLDERDAQRMNTLNNEILNAYSEGNINNEQYTNLKSENSALFEEIFRKRIDSLKESFDEDKSRSLDRIKDDIRDAYSKGKISELHFKLLNERIAGMTI